MPNETYEENLDNLTADLINWLFRDVYYDLDEEQKFILRCYLVDFTELFKKFEREEILKKMFEDLPDWMNKKGE